MQWKESKLQSNTIRQVPMADCSSLPSATDKNRKPTSSFFSSPRLFTNFAANGSFDAEGIMSPTSILDSKPFSAIRNSFLSEVTTPKTPEAETGRHWEKFDSKGIGLALIDALVVGKPCPEPSTTESRMVLFGSRLKIQIPNFTSSMTCLPNSPKSPANFGIKTRHSQLSSFSSGLSPSPVRKPVSRPASSGSEIPNSQGVFKEGLSQFEMENSEEYTRVICRGLNPRTTHIFDNCIIENCSTEIGDSAFTIETDFPADKFSNLSDSFLSFCYKCKKALGQGIDIYMYRGEKAFCSSECRHQVMQLEEGMDKEEEDDVHEI